MSLRKALLPFVLVALACALFLWQPWLPSTPGAVRGSRPAPPSGALQAPPGAEAEAAPSREAEPPPTRAATRQQATIHTSVRGRFAPLPGLVLHTAEVDLAPAPEQLEGGVMGMLSLGTEMARLKRKAQAAGEKPDDSLVRLRMQRLLGRSEPVMTAPLARNGTFAFRNPAPGRYVVRIRHPLARSADESAFELRRGDHVDLGLLHAGSAASLLAVVADPEGRPVPGVQVELRRQIDVTRLMNPAALGDPLMILRGVVPLERRTDARGTVRYVALPAEARWHIRVEAAGFVDQQRPVHLLTGRENLVRIDLDRGARIRVTVLDEQGVGRAGVRVSVSFPDIEQAGPVRGVPGRERETWKQRRTSSVGGRVDLAGLPGGRALVEATPVGYLAARRELVLAPDGDVAVELRLERGETISGRVLDAAGAPLPTARVLPAHLGDSKLMGTNMADFLGDLMHLEVERQGIAVDARGRFTLGGLSRGQTTTLMAAAPGFDLGRIDGISAGTQNAEFRLEKAVSLRGIVRGEPDGAPVPDFTVKLERRAFLIMTTTAASRRFTGRADGSFVLDQMARQQYDARIEAPGFGPFVQSVDLRRGSVDLGEIRLLPPAAIEGVTLDPQGRPATGVLVRVARGGAADSLLFSKMLGQERVESDADGRFRIENLLGTRVRLLADLEGFAPLRSKVIRLEQGTTTRGVVLQLERGGSIRGFLVDADHRPLEGWHAQAALSSGRGLRFAQTDASGAFLLEGLAAGTYKVDCIAPGAMMTPGVSQAGPTPSFDFGKVLQKITSQTVSTRVVVRKQEQTEVRLVFEGSAAKDANDLVDVVGRVHVGSAPLARGQAFFHRTGSGEQLRVVSVRDGDFGLRLRPGHYRVRVQQEFLSGPLGRTELVRIPRAETHRIELRFPGGALRGRVVEAKDGRPAAGIVVSLAQPAAGQAVERMMIGEGTTLTGDDGGFRFDGLHPGTYEIFAKQLVTRGGLSRSARLSGLTLAAGEVRGDLVLRLEEGAELRVLVEDGRGPTANALVTLLNAQGRSTGLFPRELTDESGSVSFPHLPAGPYLVAVDAPHAAATVAGPVQVPESGLQQTTVVLEPGVPTRLQLEGEIPEAARGELVLFAIWRDGTLVRSGRRTLPSSGQGAVPVGRLLPGAYRLRLECASLGVVESQHRVAKSGTAHWPVRLPQ